MKNYFTLLFLLMGLSVFAQKYDIIPRQINAFNELKNTTDGENWTISSLDSLRSRESFPYIKDGNPCSYNNNGHIPLEIWDLTNNNLSGIISDDFAWQPEDPGRWYYPIAYSGILKFSHNNITSLTKFLGFAYYNNYVSELWLDNNQLTNIDIMNPQDDPMNNYNFYLYCSSEKFCIHQNELTSLRMENLGMIPMCSTALIGYRSKLIRIDNNRLNFNDIISLTTTIASWKEYIPQGGTSAGCEYEFKYAPQKNLGGDHTEVKLQEGSSQTLNFELIHNQNVYTWLLNGKPVGATGKSYTINYLDAQQAGVYTCKITNPELNDLTLYSYDMAVWLQKDDNNSPNEITLSSNTANEKMPLFTNVGKFSAIDPDEDQTYFRLDDKKANNSNFRIINGNTLVVADKLFEYEFITEYTIIVEAYDCFGGNFEKTFTIEKGEAGSTVNYPTAIELSSNTLNENSVEKIGNFNLIGVNNNDYILSLPAGESNNDRFEIKNNNELYPKVELNFENKPSYNILLKLISSDNTITLEKDFVVTIKNLNDQPNDIMLFGNEVVLGDKLNSLIGILSTNDEDLSDNIFIYEFDNSSESDNNCFRLSKNTLLTGKNFNDSDLGVKTIIVKTTDKAGLSFSKSFSIEIKSVSTENNPPRSIGLTNTVISSTMEVGDLISIIMMSDPEGEIGTFACENKYVEISNTNLTLKLKPEEGYNFDLTISASDGENEINQTVTIYTAKNCEGTDIVDIENQKISVYPNPTNNSIHIDGIKNGNYCIYNIQGSKLIETKENTINVGNLTNGTYIIKITTETNSFTKTFIKQ